MEWEKLDERLVPLLEKQLTGCAARKAQMFGCPVWFVGDNMFSGVKGSAAFMRLGEDDRAAIAAECDEVAPFEPRPGTVMREYVSVPETVLTDDAFMQKWLQKSFAYTSSLPPKVKKAKKPS
jgi:TfoX/Sxy family transcriptional regulator of competence genes